MREAMLGHSCDEKLYTKLTITLENSFSLTNQLISNNINKSLIPDYG